MSTAAAQIIHAVEGLDGPEAPLLPPEAYSWPQSEEDATPPRMAAFFMRRAVEALHASRGDGSGGQYETAVLAEGLSAAISALYAHKPEETEEFTRELWHGAEFDPHRLITWGARAMGIPLEVEK